VTRVAGLQLDRYFGGTAVSRAETAVEQVDVDV
jgi:hypothetical protein